MARTKILILGDVRFATAKRDELARDYDVIQVESKDRQSFIKDCEHNGRYGSAHAMYVGGFGSRSYGWDSSLVEALPQHLRFLCSMGAGYDHLVSALDAATKRGIQVSHTPNTVDDATATVAMFHVLSCFRQFWNAQSDLRAGKWKKRLAVAHDPEGKTLGIIGLGGIGRALAKRALPFKMRIVYHNRHPVDDKILKRDFPDVDIKYYERLEDLLAVSDVVSISVPLSDSTRHLISEKQFEAMKESAYLVNTSRGPIIDEHALLKALDSGQIAGAGMDVFDGEPEVNAKLIDNDRLTLTPHVGTWTVETLQAMEEQVMGNIRAGLETGHVIDLVAEQKGRF